MHNGYPWDFIRGSLRQRMETTTNATTPRTGTTDHPDGRRDRSASPAWTWVLLGAAAVVVRLLSTGIMERGDGIVHYQIARFSWQHPKLFLDLWGKPLFTLGASLFAQLGHWGMAVFNATCFVLTAWAADGILKRAGNAVRWFHAPALLFVPVYGMMVIEGMTEILFGLLTILALRAAVENKPSLMAVIVSLMPFSRPEYVGFAPFALAWLILGRHWRSIPLLLAGHVVYAILSAIFQDDVLWEFTGDPYRGAKDIYGSGPLDHFFVHLHAIYGEPLVIALAITIPLYFYFRSATRTDDTSNAVLILALLPSLAIFMIHSVLWWQGLKGSLGLLRVLATTAPMLVLFVFWTLGTSARYALRRPGMVIPVVIGLGLLHLNSAFHTFRSSQELPIPADKQQLFMDDVSDRLAELGGDRKRVAYHQVYLAYRNDLDPFDRKVKPFVDPHATDLGLQEGDLLVWDAHYSANEGHLDLQWLLEHPAITYLDHMAPEEEMIVLGGRPFEVFFFERTSAERWNRTIPVFDLEHGAAKGIDLRIDTVVDPVRSGEGHLFAENEFPFELSGLPITGDGLAFARITIECELLSEETDLFFVLTTSRNGEVITYDQRRVRKGPSLIEFKINVSGAGDENKLYLWDHGSRGAEFSKLNIGIFQHFCRPT